MNSKILFSVLLFTGVLFFGCIFELNDQTGSGGSAIVVRQSSPADVQLAQGASVLLKIDDKLVNVSLRRLSDTEAVYLLAAEEVTVLTDGTTTYVDLDGDSAPNLRLRVKKLLNSVPDLEVSQTATVASATLVPKMCTEGFAKASTANVVFVLDKSLSMDYPVKQNDYPGAPANLLTHIETLKQKLPQLASEVTDEQLGEFLGSGDCDDIPESSKVLCDDVNDAFDKSRSILKGSDEFYNKFSKMAAAKKTASNVLSVVKSMQRLSKANVSVALVSFSRDADIDARLTIDFSIIQEGINDISTSPSTNIGDGLRKAFAQTTGKTADNNIIVLLTDGRPSSGLTSGQIISEFGDRASDEKTVIHAIGLGLIEQEVDKNLLQALATQSRGSYSFVSTGDELKTAFETALGVGNIKC